MLRTSKHKILQCNYDEKTIDEAPDRAGGCCGQHLRAYWESTPYSCPLLSKPSRRSCWRRDTQMIPSCFHSHRVDGAKHEFLLFPIPFSGFHHESLCQRVNIEFSSKEAQRTLT